MFHELERYVTTHRSCGGLTRDVGEVTDTGYRVRVASSCGAMFGRWIMLGMADEDLLRSSLSAFRNQTG